MTSSNSPARPARGGIGWLVVIALLVLLAFVVPFTLLRDVNAWYGSFLFWTLVSMAVIAVTTRLCMRWED